MSHTESNTLLKWEVRQRLTLLESTVFWTGELVTNFLTDAFNISRVQATKDIGLYLSLRPDNLRYDRSLKRYQITEQFQPLLITGNPQECLQVLQATRNAASPVVVTLINNLPPVEVVSPTSRSIDLDILRAVLQAARFGWTLEIKYQSLTRPEPATRIVQPKTLVFDGLRWHMRAYSLTHSDFRDFVLARIHRAILQGKSKPAPPDTLWDNMLTVEVGPHPGLSNKQKCVVERDYGMVDGRLTCSVRAALLPYWLLAMRIGRDDLQREALVQQIVLLNREALQSYCEFG